MKSLHVNLARCAVIWAICIIYGLPAAAAPLELGRPRPGLPLEPGCPRPVAPAISDLAARAASNDWAGVSNAWRALDMRQADQAAAIRAAAKALPAAPETAAMRREMATQLRLLDAAPAPELADVEPYDVPVVEVATLDVETLDVQAIAIPGLTYTVLDVLTLQPDVLRALGIQVPLVDVEIVRIDNSKFCELMRLWEARYARQIDYRDAHGNRLVPMPGTVLWRERRAVIQAAEAGGDYDALWDAYNARLAVAVHRRENLKRGRR